MNNRKKQTAVVAVATVLSVTSIASPLAVMAQEDTPAPPVIMQERQQKTAPDIILPENLQATEGTALKDVVLPDNWAWVKNSTLITTETAEYPARFKVDDVTYDYSKTEGYHAQENYVERMVTVTVEPAKKETAEPAQGKSRMLRGNMPTTYGVGDVEISVDNFPDEALRTWLGQQSYGADGTITQAEIVGITTIDISWNTSIKDLTGIEHFTALTYLNCGHTGIKSLDISQNSDLQSLLCNSNTNLKSLTVSGATALTELDCSYTGITSLNVSQNTALTTLNCNNTGITSLGISQNTALTTLYCNNTGITSLNVSQNTALTILDCAVTGITGLDVSQNTVLTYFSCRNTPLTYLNIGINNNLISVSKDMLKPVSLEVKEDKGDSFNMANKFADIDISKISNVKGADYDSTTGIMSNYRVGTPVTYTYACGTSGNGAETIDVTINLTDTRANSTISVIADLHKPYDGNAVNVRPAVSRTGSTGTVSYKWERKKNATDWGAIASAPTDAGTYRVTAILASDDDYKGATSAPVEFTISKATNSWTDTLSITGWTYGETASEPTATATFGKVSYLYRDGENGTYTDAVPSNAGTWHVKAVVKGTDNYEGLESDAVSFVIAPKNITSDSQITVPDITADTNLDELVVKDGDKVLVQGTDYDVTKAQDGNKVTVTITFKGNYTGTITKTYTIEEKTLSSGDKDKAVQTGDTTSVGLWATLLTFSAGVAVFLKRKKQEKETEE